jgi:iron only hydrogenase large subunit-like protein
MGIEVIVNGQVTEAQKGETILSVLEHRGIHVPTLCRIRGLSPSGACRMCVVEVDGRENLVPACSFPIEGPLSITTHSPRVLRARRANVELLLANHPDDCLYCERNRNCELQTLAEELNIRERRIPDRLRPRATDRSSPAVILNPSLCILCGRCIRVCEEIMANSTLEFAFRGNELKVSTAMGKPLRFSNCISCGQCITACPTGAFTGKSELDELLAHLNHPGKHVVVQYTPAAAASVCESLGIKPGKEMAGWFNAILYGCGFDQVFESALGSEIMIMEGIRSFQEHASPKRDFPVLTSSCPAWVQFLNRVHPAYASHLSGLKTPHQILGRMIREQLADGVASKGKEVTSVLITTCIAAKKEATLEKMIPDGKPVIDLVLTAGELIRLVRLTGLSSAHIVPLLSDSHFNMERVTGIMGGAAGGEAEAFIRNLHYVIESKPLKSGRLRRFRIQKPYREVTLEVGNEMLRIGAVSGLSRALEVLAQLESGKLYLDYLEVMACPSGCVNGGGQPHPVDDDSIKNRIRYYHEYTGNNPPVPFIQNHDFQKFISGGSLISENRGKDAG